MKGLILAAGDGGRLRPLTLRTPKVLLDAGGYPLIHYPLHALRSAGVSEVAVVVGFEAAQVEETLADSHPEVTFIYNQNHERGNALSIAVAREFIQDDWFVVSMGDHVIDPEIVQRLVTQYGNGCVLCTDSEAWHPSQLGDATRVLVDAEGYVAEIGKSLQIWSAVDTGVFGMTPTVFSTIERLTHWQGLEVSISDVVRHMAGTGRPFASCDVSGSLWADVDTMDDYLAVQRLLN